MRHKRPWNAVYSMDVCHFGILFPAEQFVGCHIVSNYNMAAFCAHKKI